MRWLKAVIARFRTATVAATPTPPVGLVLPEPTAQLGSNNTARATRPRSKPAKQAKKLAKKPASKTKPAAKRTPAKAPVQTRMGSRSGGRGK